MHLLVGIGSIGLDVVLFFMDSGAYSSLVLEVGPPTTCKVSDSHLHHHGQRPNREPAHPWIVKK